MITVLKNALSLGQMLRITIFVNDNTEWGCVRLLVRASGSMRHVDPKHKATGSDKPQQGSPPYTKSTSEFIVRG